MSRSKLDGVRDTSLIPDGEVDLVPIVLSNEQKEVVFATAANFVQTLAGSPLILLVKSSADFYEGQASTDATKNVVREADVWHSIPVQGRTSWFFRGTATIKGKLLTGN